MWVSSRENLADDVLDGNLLNIDVAHGQFIEQRFADGDHAVTLDFEFDAGRGFLNHFTIFGQSVSRTTVGTVALDGHQFEIGKAVEHFAEAAIKKDRAVVDDDDARSRA